MTLHSRLISHRTQNRYIMNTFDKTLSTSIEHFQNIGYTSDFKLKGDKMQCLQTKKLYEPKDMIIIKNKRFEGMSNPSDMSALFVIKCYDGTKGLIVAPYGTYGDVNVLDFLDKVKVQKTQPENKALLN